MDERKRLKKLSQSRTETGQRVEHAKIALAGRTPKLEMANNATWISLRVGYLTFLPAVANAPD